MPISFDTASVTKMFDPQATLAAVGHSVIVGAATAGASLIWGAMVVNAEYIPLIAACIGASVPLTKHVAQIVLAWRDKRMEELRDAKREAEHQVRHLEAEVARLKASVTRNPEKDDPQGW